MHYTIFKIQDPDKASSKMSFPITEIYCKMICLPIFLFDTDDDKDFYVLPLLHCEGEPT